MRCSILLLALVTIVSSTAAQTASTEHRPLNVLFIAVDDLRPELGCYGAAHAPTPNIDHLAAEGIAFRNHFVQVPTCGASRYALLTGRSPANSGAMGNGALYNGKTALSAKELPGAQTLPELFRRNGYHTTLIGKISHTADGRVYGYDGKGDGRAELPHAWDDFATPFGDWKRGWGIFFAYANGKHREDGQGHRDLMEFVVEEDEDLPDGLMAQTAVQKLQALKSVDKPFFMGLGFFKPHLPFVAPREDWEAVAKLELPPPPHPDKPDSPYWHPSGEFFGYDFPFEVERPMSAEQVDRCRRAYLACVRYTDRQIGKVLDALDETGLAESTVVVLWGDHGWSLGDSYLWGKHAPFERAVRSPLILRAPGIGKHGVTSDALVETIDLFPTLMDLCGPFENRETTFPLDGLSLRPILDSPNSEVREAALSYWRDAVSVRTKEHRLVWSRNRGLPGAELYDASTDFDPVKNLAQDLPEVVERLREFVPVSHR